ncbi:unnamed protein product [Anisakis simplex]|uniref:FHA domain-containing protein n=1 Tax=Anisakis simplex TaxID=6269 RepID=A0A3P6Q2V6_ANISI|nr:unnamed protein product [Anisakis simplex]
MKDCGTVAGTYLNSEAVVKKTQIKSGDVIRFGYGAEFVFEINTNTYPLLVKVYSLIALLIDLFSLSLS